jgi:hypothetical protein
VSIKYTPTSSIARPSKIYPNLDLWFENKPSGNPGDDLKLDFKNSQRFLRIGSIWETARDCVDGATD